MNLFIGKNRVYLVGEYISSFDYEGHIQNIMNDFKSNPGSLFQLTTCTDCPILYAHSRWEALHIFIVNAIGKYIGLHPFIWYLYIILVVNLIGYYAFIKLVVKKFQGVPFVISFISFFFAPLHFNLLGGGLQIISNGMLLLMFALLIHLYSNLGKIMLPKLVLLSVLFGITLAFFFNIGLIYFPLVFYYLVIISMYYWKIIIDNLAKFYLIVSSNILIPILFNLPIFISIIYSYISTGNIRELNNYISYGLIDSLTGISLQTGLNNLSIIVFFGLIIILFFKSKIRLQYKMVMVSIYFLVVIILLGVNSPINLFDWIFMNFPLMKSIRATYRFAFLQILIYSLIIYCGLLTLSNLKIYFFKFYYIIIVAIVLSIHINFLIENRKYFHSIELPDEYIKVKNYFYDIRDKVIYFPSYVPNFTSMTNNFDWYNVNAQLQSLYPNPFNTILSLRNLIQFENFNLSITNREIKSLTSYNVKPGEILNALEYAGIRYVIVDKNYFWQKNYPDFDIDSFTRNLILIQRYGNLSIYKLTDRSSDCLRSYGNYKAGYCVSLQDNPRYLVAKSVRDYYLDKLELGRSNNIIDKNSASRWMPGIFSPELSNYINDNHIMVPYDIFEPEKNDISVFSSILEKKSYKLLLPLLKISESFKIFRDSVITVYLDDKLVYKAIPYGDKIGMYWEEIEIDNSKASKAILTIGTQGEGFVVLGKPLLFDQSEWNRFSATIQRASDNYILINE